MKYNKKKIWYNQKLTCRLTHNKKVNSIIKNDGILALMESDPKGHNF